MVYLYKINTAFSLELYNDIKPIDIDEFLNTSKTFFDNINKNILSKIQNDSKLVIIMSDEGDVNQFDVSILELLLKKYNIPTHNFYFIHNIFEFPKCNFNQLYLNSHLINAIKVSNNILNKNHNQIYKFHFPIRRFRKHRIKLLEELFIDDNTFIENNLVSFDVNFLDNKNQITNLNSQFKTHISRIQKKVIDIEDFSIMGHNIGLSNTYEKSCITILTETMFYEDYNYLSEKIWKPLMHQHPFILLGRPYALKSLHKLGFKTFNSIIDESYDNELDDTIRFNMVLNEIFKLNRLTLLELIQKVNSINDILIFNQNHLSNMELNKLELEKTNFIFENQAPTKIQRINNIL
jgi:hypothetical protein